MLHTVNKSPNTNSAFDEAVRYSTPGSTILLLEDGVYAAAAGSAAAAKLAGIADRKFVALDADVAARGIRLADGVLTVDYAGFVKLVEGSNMMAWG